MRPPAEAGEPVVDLRPIGKLPYQRVILAVVVVIVLGVSFGTANGWKVVVFFVGPIAAVTWVLLRVFRLALFVCERGLVVRNFVRATFVPWSSVRGLRVRRRAYKGVPFRQYVIDAGGRPILLPGPASRRADIDRVQRAVQAIEQHAGIKLEREPGAVR